ncbi:MAG: hypothetical protein ACFFDN_08370 [Candidatus Hodarchaeota archaeon]
MEAFIKKFVDALYNGKFGVVFSRASTKVKHFKKIDGEEILIRYKDAIDKKQGIQILFDYNRQSYEIKFRGKTYEKLTHKIKKYFGKNNLKNGIIEEI